MPNVVMEVRRHPPSDAGTAEVIPGLIVGRPIPYKLWLCQDRFCSIWEPRIIPRSLRKIKEKEKGVSDVQSKYRNSKIHPVYKLF